MASSGTNKPVVQTYQSLIISPNLDALLEYDARARMRKSPTTPTTPLVQTTPLQQKTDEPILQPLPLPPRRRDRSNVKSSGILKPKVAEETREKVQPEQVEEEEHELSEEESNPWLNPVPDFSGGYGVHSETKIALSPPKRSPGIMSKRPTTPLLPSPSSSKSFDVNVNDKRVTIIESRREDVTKNQRARSRGKLVKKGKSRGAMEREGEFNKKFLLNYDSDGQPVFVSRPYSGISTESGWSYPMSAATTDEQHRISISSTVYFSSASDHLDLSLNVPPLPPPDRNSKLISYSNEISDTSFLDLLSSPTSNEFDSMNGPRSNKAPKSSLSSSPTASSKPPIPTSAKPAFNRLRKSEFSPTSNRLNPSERSQLVLKSRKLTQVFGQTPEAGVLSIASGHLLPDVQRYSLNAEIGRRHSVDVPLESPSRMSFIDFSDGEATPTRHFSESSGEEEERRRKREKLAKLHRFLGSRVPTNLVLGLGDPLDPSSLPPLPSVPAMDDDPNIRAWLRRRRSSSVVLPSWRDDLDRLKTDLDDQEKAINVRRAVKMEKVFGVAPPQTLYHTRQCSPVTVSTSAPLPSASSKKSKRPGTADSSTHLLSTAHSPSHSVDDSNDEHGHRYSIIYSHYQQSLNSLNDIIDRDDRASLAELHEYLTLVDTPSGLPTHPTTKADRRRSLPARTSSIISYSSENSFASSADHRPDDEPTSFQLRRRRAAKLTQFFGVDYRELVEDVLNSIETGLEFERTRGTLLPAEFEALLRKLRTLKTKPVGAV